MDRSLGQVQVGYSGTSEVRSVGSVIFQPLKCKQAIWKRCKNCKLLLILLMRHELLFASIAVSFEISSLSLCRNYFLCERSHKDDAQDEGTGKGWWVCVRGSWYVLLKMYLGALPCCWKTDVNYRVVVWWATCSCGDQGFLNMFQFGFIIIWFIMPQGGIVNVVVLL